jgi:hypothetical protein
LDIEKSVLLNARRRLGMPVRKQKKPQDFSHLTADGLRALYQRYKNWNRVAEHLGTSNPVLVRIRKRLGMEIDSSYPDAKHRRKKPGRLDSEVERIRELAAKGWSCGMIAEAIGNTTSEQVRRRMVREGIPRRPEGAMPGKLNNCWRGGRQIDKDGYVRVPAPPGHPYAKANGYICEHRLVMEQKLGRYLDPEEVVHHIDGDKGNNDPANLELFADNGEHLAHEWADPEWAAHQSEIRKTVIAEEESLEESETCAPS